MGTTLQNVGVTKETGYSPFQECLVSVGQCRGINAPDHKSYMEVPTIVMQSVLDPLSFALSMSRTFTDVSCSSG
jgi:hypothetical protein